MPLKKRTKNIQKKQNDATPLRTWIFDMPAKFALVTFGLMFVISVIYAAVASLLNTSDTRPLLFILFLSFIWSICYLVKKLAHTNMYRDGFIAITNACCIITACIPSVILLFTGTNIEAVKRTFITMHITHPSTIWIILLCAAILYLYVFGLVISNIYAKYKRAREIGISKWKIICSFPFAFLLMWAPGYLINDKKNDSGIMIKSKLYSKFNKWVVANTQNTLATFLVLVMLNNVYSDASSLLLTLFLLVIYTLWYIKHKKDFLKNINRGYALSAVSINMITIFMLIITALTHVN